MTASRRRGASESQQNAATCLAMSGLLLLSGGLLGLMTLVLPDIGWALLVIFGMACFVLMHYLTWGRRLSRLRPRDEQPPDEPPLWDEPQLD